MGYAENDSVERFMGLLRHDFNAIVLFDGLGIGPRIKDSNPGCVFFQCRVDIYNLGVANIRTILFEGDS